MIHEHSQWPLVPKILITRSHLYAAEFRSIRAWWMMAFNTPRAIEEHCRMSWIEGIVYGFTVVVVLVVLLTLRRRRR
jgi:hypothetical protein